MRGLADGLGKLGHEVYYLGWQTFGQPHKPAVFHDRVLHFEGLPNTGRAQFGQKALPYWIVKKEPDVILTLGDFWMLSWMWKSDYVQPHCYWYPIDGVPVTDDIIRMLKRVDIPVAFSKFGKRLVTEAGIRTHYVPHGVNTKVFRPLPQHVKEETRREYGLPPKAFVVGRVDRNQRRKMYPQTLKAFKIFKKWYPDSVLYLHCDKRDREGWDLPFVCKRLGLKEGRDVFFPPPEKMHDFMLGVSESEMNRIYNMFDIHLPLTGGEGFGLTILQSMAAGVPNVATDYTTPPELIGDCGMLVRVEYYCICGAGVDRAYADPEDAAAKMKELRENPDLYEKFKRRGVEKARNVYDWEKCVVPSFDRLLRQEVGK
ncbi:hypothetical protein DRN84_04160 [Candidatus Geothermarchaeota archaeon]|nr:MAG: hypothetical protein DRN84_04160 [Candidatus Geothermarchaeota archaeon]